MTQALQKKNMKTMRKSRLNNQDKLKVVCDDLCNNISDLLDVLDLKYSINAKMVSMCCPIHGGDNPSAINLYYTGDYYRGNWKCRTHNCEEIFKGSIIGFVRGVISSQKYGWTKDGDEACSFDEAVDFCLKFLKKNLKDIKISKTHKEKTQFTNLIETVFDKNLSVKNTDNNIINRDVIRKSLIMPCQYFIDRGFAPEVLDKYDVGLCNKPDKEMYQRAVVPIYNHDLTNMIGCTGRSIFEKCSSCNHFHDPNGSCPKSEELWKYSKWKHSSNCKINHHLYNFWYAKEHIAKTNSVILVESPGNVWKLEENGIHNSVAIFGSSLGDRQKILLDSSGAMVIIVLTDNDDAGHKAAEQITGKCKNTYRVFRINISTNDVAEMTSDQIKTEIKDVIESIV
jgi:5S rRNA maturation endonuclease (ribonuclease M5)